MSLKQDKQHAFDAYCKRIVKNEAISAVLQHYEGYIARLSLRPIQDSHGRTRLCVDEAMRRRLEIKLITSILAFRVA